MKNYDTFDVALSKDKTVERGCIIFVQPIESRHGL